MGDHAAASQTAVSPLVRELSADARRAIRLNGGRHVTREQAVATSHKAAARLLFGGSGVVDDNERVYVIQLIGHFVGYTASWPAGGHAPTGPVMVIVLDAKTLRTVDWGLSAHAHALSKLGTPFDLVA